MSKYYQEFDGNYEAVKHFPPSFLFVDFPKHLETLRTRTTAIRNDATTALSAHGPDNANYQDLSRKATNWDVTLLVANDYLKDFKIMAPMYRDLLRKVASANEGTWHHLKSRKGFAMKMTERDITNKELEEAIDEFYRYEKDVMGVRNTYVDEIMRMKTLWEALLAMDVERMGDDLRKSVEKLAYESSLLFKSPPLYVLLLITKLHCADPLFAEGILWHSLDRFPKAAKLSQLEVWVPFKRKCEKILVEEGK
ncbi:hypothetical protein K458DRAFT_409609 [Lentithecium fluviatile CBS 122367]|uniref:Uncharacterized protein n=1 Tax=Lentithecium fluviatile CBS 122367 TaxID=1168545 RepID=A0A6G1IHT3_9PLEO|nr:hypothetical protein K458DRAFT_409609 [Lentithecium fluviatile CBS 122367]